MAFISVANLAQLSSLLPILWMMLWSFLTGRYSKDGVHRQERSLVTDSDRKRRRKLSIWKDRIAWWFQDEILVEWGTRIEWLFAVFWFLWLGLLAAHSANRGNSTCGPSDTRMLTNFCDRMDKTGQTLRCNGSITASNLYIVSHEIPLVTVSSFSGIVT